MVLVRREIGDVLRDMRRQQGRTLRQVASKASVALGYLSEVERGQKEVSSEILASVAEALNVPVSAIMHEVGDRMALLESLAATPVSGDYVGASRGYTGAANGVRSSLHVIPDVFPDDLVAAFEKQPALR